MSENSFPQVSRAALKRLFSLSVHDSLPAETQRRVSRETNTNRSACQVSQSLWWSVYSPAAQDITRLTPSWLSASVDTTSFLYIILVDLKRQSERESEACDESLRRLRLPQRLLLCWQHEELLLCWLTAVDCNTVQFSLSPSLCFCFCRCFDLEFTSQNNSKHQVVVWESEVKG